MNELAQLFYIRSEGNSFLFKQVLLLILKRILEHLNDIAKSASLFLFIIIVKISFKLKFIT